MYTSGCPKNQRKQKQERRHQNSPGKERHLVQRHARRAHVQNRRNEIDRTKDRRRTRNVDCQNGEIHSRSRLTRGRQRRIQRPTAAGTPATGRRRHEQRDHQQQQCRRQKPERNIVHARESHVRRADHQRHHPVGKATDQRRHDHEKDHDQSVRGGEHIEHLFAGIKCSIALNTVDHGRQPMENLNARLLKFGAHRDGQCATDDTGDDCKNQVQSTDVFMIGRVYPTNPAVRLVVVVGTMLVSCCASHGIRSRFSTVLAFGI
jgi:hypothetical protein